MQKILLFTLEYPPFKGGVANYYENVVKHWPNSDEIFILNNNDNKLIKPHWLFALFKLLREIKNIKIDHVLVGQILPLGTVTYILSKFIKLDYTIFIHGMSISYTFRKSRKKFIAKRILTGAKNIICESNYTAEIVKKFLGEEYADKVHVVNPGVDASRNLEENSESEDVSDKVTSSKLRVTKPFQAQRMSELQEKYNLKNKIVLFSVGRLVKRKGFDKVIQAMKEATASVPNLYYFIAGDGPDKKYIYDQAEGVPNIVFLGKISDEDKWTWLNLCDIFITVSREIKGDFEGFGIVYLEANICKKPVIAGDSGGVRDAVKSAYSGILVDPENIERIADAIITLAKDEDLRKKLGEQGRQRALKEFRWEDKVREICEIICKV